MMMMIYYRLIICAYLHCLRLSISTRPFDLFGLRAEPNSSKYRIYTFLFELFCFVVLPPSLCWCIHVLFLFLYEKRRRWFLSFPMYCSTLSLFPSFSRSVFGSPFGPLTTTIGRVYKQLIWTRRLCVSECHSGVDEAVLSFYPILDDSVKTNNWNTERDSIRKRGFVGRQKMILSPIRK